MPNLIKIKFLDELNERFGPIRKLGKSQSLFEIGNTQTRLYVRYSKKHTQNRTFFGLRKIDLQLLEGHVGFLCFLWEGQNEPLLVPFDEFEEIFNELNPASDGQFKVQVYEQQGGTELYVANAGRFNVESYVGWTQIEKVSEINDDTIPNLSHSQVQTLLCHIGAAKGFDVWIPRNDRSSLDDGFGIFSRFPKELPPFFEPIKEIAEQIDVIWLERGANCPIALYEVEHSTPIYSGLLRFNDVHISTREENIRFGIVSNNNRKSLFIRQIARPTFRISNLRDSCTFLEYNNVYAWYKRLQT